MSTNTTPRFEIGLPGPDSEEDPDLTAWWPHSDLPQRLAITCDRIKDTGLDRRLEAARNRTHDITTPTVQAGALVWLPSSELARREFGPAALITAHGAVIRELTADEEQRARAAVAQP